MNLKTEAYLQQLKRWPAAGRHILAQFDADTIVVYQAYRPAIGQFAAAHQRFGGEFSFNRMSWIKPNFLWMMYRSGWGTKEGQEVTLAIQIRRAGFDEILAKAVHSSFVPEAYSSAEQWKSCLAESPVRLQWDPDHAPNGAKQERRAIQLGLAGTALRRFVEEWIVGMENISEFVSEQRERALSGDLSELRTPIENVLPIRDGAVAARLGIDEPHSPPPNETPPANSFIH
jgi:hypothetical protein